jgi:hypothetical protein
VQAALAATGSLRTIAAETRSRSVGLAVCALGRVAGTRRRSDMIAAAASGRM